MRPRDELSGTLNADALQRKLDAYESTGDHDHGRGPIVGDAQAARWCAGGDCLALLARRVLALLKEGIG